MRAPRSDANPERTGRQDADRGGPAALLDFAVTQITEDRPLASSLPSVLERLVATFGLRAAIAFRPGPAQTPTGQAPAGHAPAGQTPTGQAPTGQAPAGHAPTGQAPAGHAPTGQAPATVLAAHPPDAGEPELLARVGRLPEKPGSAAQAAAQPLPSVQLPVRLGGRACRALVVHPPPVDGQRLCALALIGDGKNWDDEVQATAHAVATLVTAQLRDTSKLAQNADQEQWLNSLIATAIPGVLITDTQGQVTHVSRSFGVMFGVDAPEQLTGTPATTIIRRIRPLFADPAGFLRRTITTLRARQPSSGEQIAAADGRTIECDYWPVVVDDEYQGAIWLLWDISDRAEVERQREEQNFRLRELDKARNDFVAMISHELRTPLTSIVSFSELIMGEAAGLTPDGLRFLDVIVRNADRLLRLIGDLLMLSRLEAGVLPLDLAAVSVPDLVREAVRAEAQSATVQDIDLMVTTGTGPPVFADSKRLLQVLDNLLSNAIKFSHRRGQVLVTASCDGQTWRIDVADTGIGIPPGEAARLFDRFVRGSNARIAGLPGTGLGLSIVKTIVEMHAGRVDVDTALNQGTMLSVYLPVMM
jgi:PAS domain S-box-containing protein